MLGSKIAVIKATDADGTAPGNIVNYEFIPERSNEKAETYFNLDRESGEITVINDLTKEVFDEYVLEILVVAWDLESWEKWYNPWENWYILSESSLPFV